ncbi:hypothetical protein M0R45_016363 [Rubus argutus]|uniref:Uncharacterized protein n=1 Tax=Rubus argutus TaxID=59490 RepID=A0AAW1XUR3_RUBAR
MSSKPLNSREYQEQVAKAEEFKRRILTLYSAKKIQPSPSNFLGYVGTAVAIGSHLYLGPWDEKFKGKRSQGESSGGKEKRQRMSSQQVLVIKSSDGIMKCSGPEKMAMTKSPKTTKRSKAILAKPISQLPPTEGTDEDTILKSLCRAMRPLENEDEVESEAPPANFVIEPLLIEEEVFGSALMPSPGSANQPSFVPRTLIIPTPGSPISYPSLSNHGGLSSHVNLEVVIINEIPMENLPVLNPIEDSITNLDKFGVDKTLGKIASSQREVQYVQSIPTNLSIIEQTPESSAHASKARVEESFSQPNEVVMDNPNVESTEVMEKIAFESQMEAYVDQIEGSNMTLVACETPDQSSSDTYNHPPFYVLPPSNSGQDSPHHLSDGDMDLERTLNEIEILLNPPNPLSSEEIHHIKFL